jgi:hypothetical protein
MTGYFSSLQRQTGIVFEAGAGAADPMSKNPAEESPQDPDAAPIEIEEHRVVESEAPDRAPPATRPQSELKLPAKSDLTATAVESLKPTHQAMQTPLPAVLQQQNPVQPAQAVNEGESLDATSESPAAETSVQPDSLTEETAVSVTATTIETPPTRSGSQRATTPIRRSVAPVSPAVREETRIVREQVWRTAYQQVIDWVAAQPVSTTREQQEQIVGKVVEQLQEKVPGVIQTESFLSGEDALALPPSTESEIRDLHLSIGKLEVRLDQPAQREGQPQRQQETKTSKSAAAPVSRRLRRRYITP